MEMGRDEGKSGEKWKRKTGGRFFLPNLAQEEAIFLVLLCQINAAFQIFISALRRGGYCVHYRGEQKIQKNRNTFSLLNHCSALQLIRILCAYMCARTS